MQCLNLEMNSFQTLLVLLAAAVMTASTPAVAASTGYVTEIITNPNNGALNFVVNGPRTELPACANGHGERWAIDGKSPLAQSTFALLIAAYAQRQKVFIQGLGNCSSPGQPDIEATSYVGMLNN